MLHHNRSWSAVVRIEKPLTLRCWSCKGRNAAREMLVDCISGVEIAFELAAGLGHILGLSSSMLKQCNHANVILLQDMQCAELRATHLRHCILGWCSCCSAMHLFRSWSISPG